jgi:type III secretion protein C
MRLLSTLLAATLIATAMAPADAADVPFQTRKFVYRAEGKKLAEVLQDFAASQSFPLVVDAGVDGTINADFNTTPNEFLAAVSKSYGLIWYFDGTTLFIYPSRAMASRVFRMRGYDRNQVKDMLSSLGLGDSRFPLRFDDVQQTLLAYGPPRHIELVQTVVDTLDGGARDQVAKTIQVFALRHTVAADRVAGQSRVPGLATTLNNIFNRGQRPGGGTAEEIMKPLGSGVGTAEKRRTAELNFGMKSDDSARKDTVRDGTGRLAAGETDNIKEERDRPFFQADEASNSIIVRGVPERMKQYEALIQQLDMPQDMVEIEATIIDVSTDEFESLGISWDFNRTTADGNRRSIQFSPGSPSGSAGTGPSITLGGANITTLVGDAGRQLLTRIRALEGNGKARIVARPKVLGAVNRMASMVDKRVASVRVAGNLEVNLFTIEAGTTLQVTPQVVPGTDSREVRLTLFIEDGSFEGTVVDSVPIVKRTEIRTEAMIPEGESLLIGGISVESDSKGRSGLPGLSRIPGLGALFRSDEGAKSRSERMFLITPKVISVAGTRIAAAAAAARAAALAPAVPASGAASQVAAMPAPAPAPVAAAPVAEAAPPPPVECAAAALGLSSSGCTPKSTPATPATPAPTESR